MKRPSLPKRRQRRTGVSPYARYNKVEIAYSADYYEWKSKHVKKAKNASA